MTLGCMHFIDEAVILSMIYKCDHSIAIQALFLAQQMIRPCAVYGFGFTQYIEQATFYEGPCVAIHQLSL